MIVKDELGIRNIINNVEYFKLYFGINAMEIKQNTKTTSGSIRSPGRNSNSKNFQGRAGGLTPRQYSPILSRDLKLEVHNTGSDFRIDDLT